MGSSGVRARGGCRRDEPESGTLRLRWDLLSHLRDGKSEYARTGTDSALVAKAV